MKRFINIVRYLFFFFLIFFLCISSFSTKWALKTFYFLNFDEVLFQLTSPIRSASSSILSSYVYEGLIPSIVLAIFIFILSVFLFKFLSREIIEFSFPLRNKDLHFHIPSHKVKVCFRFFLVFLSVFILYTCLDKIYFIDFVKYRMHSSTFIEENYVDPKNVDIIFPQNKKNLIYIYVESYESSFFSKDLGGVEDNNYLEPMIEFTSNNISFSDSELFGGATNISGTNWTSAAIVSQTAGLPLKMNLSSLYDRKKSVMLDNAYTLGDILEKNGYNQEFMIGSNRDFGYRGDYFTKHGHYKIFDYGTAKELGKIEDDYFVWWGVEDSKLFEYAKEEIIDLANKEEPFNFTLLTANTHPTDGYVEESCEKKFDDAYRNSVYCSSLQIASFIQWIQEQDFYPNTTIIVVGDHMSMQAGLYTNDYKRRIYNLFINSSVTEGNFKNRNFTTMDMFPTTLASMGVVIEGDKLGLGTNLFSDRKTLLEEVGYDTLEEEILNYSSFYNNTFFDV